MKPSEILEEKNRKEVERRVKALNENIKDLIRHAQSYIKTVDPVVELNFEEVTITEFRCEQCGYIFDVDEPVDKKIDKRLAQKTGFKVSHHRLEFRGLCTDCQS